MEKTGIISFPFKEGKRSIGILLLVILVPFFLSAQDLSQYKKEVFVSKAGNLPYRVLYPENFDPAKKYPLMIFLHGRGESGDNNESQLNNGGKLFLKDDIRKAFPVITIFPQCPVDSYWANVETDTVNTKRFFTFRKGGSPTVAMQMLLNFTDVMVGKPYVDKSKVYVGGLSMGGMGTFELLRRMPKTFSAAFSICGGDNVKNVKKYKHVPLWIFHGGLDDVVTPQFSFWIYNELKRFGADPKFSVYPKANHNSWDSAFAEPELLPWVFSHSKN